MGNAEYMGSINTNLEMDTTITKLLAYHLATSGRLKIHFDLT